MRIVRSTLESFNYYSEYWNDWDFMNPNNFHLIKESILRKEPVFMLGFPKGDNGSIKYTQGHAWVLDGYKFAGISIAAYTIHSFDEYGQQTSIEQKTYTSQIQEFVHANIGNANEAWVMRGIYQYGSKNYNGRVTFIPGIKPKSLL